MTYQLLYNPEKNSFVMLGDNDVVLIPIEVDVDVYVYRVANNNFSLKNYELVDRIED